MSGSIREHSVRYVVVQPDATLPPVGLIREVIDKDGGMTLFRLGRGGVWVEDNSALNDIGPLADDSRWAWIEPADERAALEVLVALSARSASTG